MHSNIFRTILLVFYVAVLPLAVNADNVKRQGFKLVIDAGHGGHDPGAVRGTAKEKDINLSVALALGRMLEEGCPDVKVVYTRRRDTFVSLQRRADIANNNKADLFISIHTNALPKGKVAYGAETYTLGMHCAEENFEVAKRENSVITYESDYRQRYKGFDPNRAESYVIFELMQDRYMKQSVDLARYIQQAYKQQGRPDKGVHQAGFLVLRAVSMPSVLTELGFVTTPREASFLTSKSGVQKMARSIYNGLRRYLKAHHRITAMPHPETAAGNVPEEQRVEVVPVPTEPTDRHVGESPDKHSDLAEAPNCDESASERHGVGNKRNVQSRKERSDVSAQSRVRYRVQVGAGVKVSIKDRQFKGLKVTCEKEGRLYKYYAGTYTAYVDARQGLKRAQAKVPGAYLVAFVDGRSVSVQEARKVERKRK